VEVPAVSIPKEKNRYVVSKKTEHLKSLKYLNVKEHPIMGKSLNTSLALSVYKCYNVRLYNNPMAEIMSRVNIIGGPLSHEQLVAVIKPVFEKYGLSCCTSRFSAVLMFLKGIGLVTMTRGGMGKKAVYAVVKAPEIPKEVSIYDQ
jgi:hypothetical protein